MHHSNNANNANSDQGSSPLNHIVPTLAPYEAILDSAILDELRNLQASFDRDIAAAREQGRALRIAVVGQMKAGKSSFLNAALLNRDLLPRAATPMTAALTRIHHADTPGARVVFYTQDDWEHIAQEAEQASQRLQEEKNKWQEAQQRNASPFGNMLAPFARGGTTARQPDEAELWQKISPQLRASWELVQQARNNHLPLKDLLGSTPEIQAATQNELAGKLRDYIGAQGQHTPLVKMIELYVDDPRIEGMEIVDTPGFNDPVISRGNITRQYLGQCDVIYLFSTVGQFLAAADLALLREQLPAKGIRKDAVFIVGSRRDEALRQDQKLVEQATLLVRQKNIPAEQAVAARLQFALQLADRKTAESGQQAITRQLQEAHDRGDQRSLDILQHLRDVKPHCVAAQLALWADQLAHLDDNAHYHIDHLQKALGQTLNAEALRQIANIAPLQQQLLAQRQHKQTLLAHKEDALRKGLRANIGQQLQALQEDLAIRAHDISHKDVTHLTQQREEINKRLQAGRSKVEQVFDEQKGQIQQSFAKLKRDFQDMATESVRIESRTETHTRSYEVSTSAWYKPWTWGNTETRYETSTTHYADVQDALDSVDHFAHRTRRDVSHQISASIDLEKLRHEIRKAAVDLFDLCDASFDGEMMKREVDKSLRHMSISDAALPDEDYSRRLVSEFGRGRVESQSRISDLREQTRQVVASILRDIQQALDNTLNAITQDLNNAHHHLVDRLIADINGSIDQLRRDIGNKEEALANIAQARKTLATAMEQLE